ncbi:archaeal heat shock protein Hsp20 [Candidatus Methanomassiliicoccus intestinalis]|uniref:archaeal heat shock protein Hsp20 n=1 Tax=Candidatus Methanomassiliicoccus intestinalis TaxID=1406512 RepID=UPI0037DDC38B
MARRVSPWDDIFGSFEEEFEDMRKRMNSMFSRYTMEDFADESTQPLIYGFSMRVGPDGKAQIQEFGNANHHQIENGEREPLTDIVDEGNKVKVIIELPGVELEDIKLNAENSVLDISVDREDRKFSKKLQLPSSVSPDSAKATYKNGVLTVIMEKSSAKGTSIKIEKED